VAAVLPVMQVCMPLGRVIMMMPPRKLMPPRLKRSSGCVEHDVPSAS
jgi:hypothetical protein